MELEAEIGRRKTKTLRDILHEQIVEQESTAPCPLPDDVVAQVCNGIFLLSEIIISRESLEKACFRSLMSQLRNNAEANLTRRELENITVAYRLAGKTIFVFSDNRIGIRFETFFNGRFHESFFVVLDYDPKTEKIFVYKHTIPYFIPIHEIEQQYLNTNLQVGAHTHIHIFFFF